jgi:hypothetical protein
MKNEKEPITDHEPEEDHYSWEEVYKLMRCKFGET